MKHTLSSPSARAGEARRGFTLLELVAVVAITGIIAAVAIPSMTGLAATKARAAARQLARDLTFARERALTTGAGVWAVFNASTPSYALLDESLVSPGRSGAAAMVDPATGRDFDQSFAAGEFAGVTIISTAIGAGNGAEVGFDWLGRPKDQSGALLTSAGTVALSFGNSITIEPETGLIRVQP